MASVPFSCGAILLAAGNSTRMGRPKQLLQLRGKSLLRQSSETVLGAALSPVVVVLGSNEALLLPELTNLAITPVSNPDWDAGMTSSIQAGLRALLSLTPELQGAIISVCDQPELISSHFHQLLEAHRSTRKPMIAMRYAAVLGPPVFFAASVFSDLFALRSAHGARELLTGENDRVLAIDAPELSIDLDTPSDYTNYLAHGGLKK